MTAASADREGQRRPGELVAYHGSSGYTYYKNCMTMVDGAHVAQPLAQGAGASMARFLGVNRNRLDRSADNGASLVDLEIWKTGRFVFAAQGTGASAHIGQVAYGIDDQTVGVSAAPPVLRVGEIVSLPSTSEYEVRIDGFTAQTYVSGLSAAGGWVPPQN